MTSYRIAYSIDGTTYEFVQDSNGADKIFDGNSDGDTLVQHDFDQALVARDVRLYPQIWNVCMSLRWELYGCDIGEFLRFYVHFQDLTPPATALAWSTEQSPPIRSTRAAKLP